MQQVTTTLHCCKL